MEPTIICGLTQEAIDKLKKKHGAVFQVDVKAKDEDKTYYAICREPDETIMSAVGAVSKTDEVKGGIVLFDNCTIACDEEIKLRLPLKMQVIKAVSDRMTAVTASVKNL